MRDGYPVFTVDGKPFFLWGAAFFYERIPRSQWRSSLEALKRLHVNTLDLYVPWNWHELSEGSFDFDGHSRPERDLRGLLRMARSLGFYLVIRPGPVIRNEWRNGGYPWWLLQRNDYGMPLHERLEGRYPPTATLQNRHSDDAAAEWLANSTHMRYSQIWLRKMLSQLAPVADRILAIQLDDDQGAYLDNQTYPAPHLRRYLQWLAQVVHSATSERVPVFINTYQMKVTGSSPVWAMGNWYQSDARVLAEHDRAQLEFSTALLGTRPYQPVMLSEFQAGWLLAPEAIYPRPSDPSNTLLALHTALGAGARGVIDFPMQDTLSPPGWSAPFANRFYAWDAALRIDGSPSARYQPTREFGDLVARDGTLLAATHPVADASIVWWPSALDVTPNAAQIVAIADATIAAERSCRMHELNCVLVDLRYASDRELQRNRAIVVPAIPQGLRPLPFAARRLEYFRSRHALLHSLGEADANRIEASRAVRGLPGATLHVGRVAGRLVAFLDAQNYSDRALDANVTIRYPGISRTLRVHLKARSAELVRLDRAETSPRTAEPVSKPFSTSWDVPIRPDARAPLGTVGSVVLQNSRVRVVIAPEAGGRAFVFEDLAHHTNAFTTVGALRDDVSTPLGPSPTDRIAAYTHTFPAGTFNRRYHILRSDARQVTLNYVMGDIPRGSVNITKQIALPADSDTIEVRERFLTDPRAETQALVVRSSLSIGHTDRSDWRPPLELWSSDAFALYDAATHEFAMVRWERDGVESVRAKPYDRHIVLRLQYANGWHTTWYSYAYIKDETEARARLKAAEGGKQP